jgi:hypothetical protein
MAFRLPLYNDSGNLKEMSVAQINDIVSQIIYQYSLSPSVLLNVVTSGGNLGTISDTRLQAGVVSTSATGFVAETTTDEPTTVTVNFAKISQTRDTTPATTDSGKLFPVYYSTAGNIHSMSTQDVLDTFVHPAIISLTSASTTTAQAGTYFISSVTSVAGATLVSATPVFTDTRADPSLYSSASIPEALDKTPITVQNYYLHRVNGVDTAFTSPMFITSDNNIREFTSSTFKTIMKEWINYTAASSAAGYSLSYNINGGGSNRGTGMANTILNGSGNYQTLQVGADDYRAQEFPDGTPITATTYFLKILQS